MSRLQANDFGAFCQAVHGYTPFAWQQRMVDEMVGRLRSDDPLPRLWDSVVDLPTGAGKTSLIDVATFLLAIDAERPAAERRVPRRIVFVVDRRVVVDQAHVHATRLAEGLQNSSDEVVRRVAEALRSYSAGAAVDAPPLRAATLRGGITRDESWAARPDVPTAICSTVDQVGSRLLFRGYGISPSMQPIHAGLLGSDTLFLLDEVHLSRPFEQTLGALADRYQTWGDVELPRRWEVVRLSATPGQTERSTFRLDASLGDEDRHGNEVLVRRIEASKPARLELVASKAKDPQAATKSLARACATQVTELLAAPHAQTLAVVVNRVATAIAAHQEVAAALKKVDADVHLLTGRMRPYDRDKTMKAIGERLAIGRTRSDADKPLVVVATQCIEAGADFDFDGLVTECASLDALIQRFGRVDRDGQLSSAGTPAHSVVVASQPTIADDNDDPVYGLALARTWDALSELDAPDFGYRRLPDELLDNASLHPEPSPAPVLLPAHLDAWVQTSPPPTPEPRPDQWLHGLGDHETDVTIVWRADITDELLADARPDSAAHDQALETLRTLVSLAPPGSLEAVSVPISAGRRWLLDQDATQVSDVDGAVEVEEPDRRSSTIPQYALRYRGDESSVIDGRSLRAGDVLVVPATRGGIGEHRSWDPASSEPVEDLAERTQLVQRRRLVLRIAPGLIEEQEVEPRAHDVEGGEHDVDAEERLVFPDPDEMMDGDLTVIAQDWLETNLHRLRGLKRGIAELLLRPRTKLVVQQVQSLWNADSDKGAGSFLVVSAVQRATEGEVARLLENAAENSVPDVDGVDSEPETSSFTSVEVDLDAHLTGVGEWARLFAENCGLPAPLVDDIALAGRLHDLGKADPRFQRMLRNGDPGWASDPPLAKSAMPAHAYGLRRRAQRLAGYPDGARHELMSLALIEHATEIQALAHDWDLVCYLVASHHGKCRPFAPVAVDPLPVSVVHSFGGVEVAASSDHGLERLDSGVPDRFWLLVRRYGWHGLAWLEAMLRLADHRRSEQEQHEGHDAPDKAEGQRRSGSTANLGEVR